MSEPVNPPPLELFTSFTKSWSGSSGECVEIALGPDGWVAIRDSKDGGEGPVLRFTAREWERFTSSIRDGRV